MKCKTPPGAAKMPACKEIKINDRNFDFASFTEEVKRRNQLTIAIKEKFGSIAAFANHSKQKLQPWTVIRTLNGEKKKDVPKILDEIEKAVKRIKTDERKITNEQRKKARRVILLEVGSAAEFNRRFPEFPRPFISKVLNGKKRFSDDRTQKFFKKIAKLDDSQNQD